MSLSPANPETYKLTGTPQRVAEGWRRLFPVFIVRTDDGWEVEIWWWRLMLSLVLAVSLGWLSATGGVFLFLKYQRGFTEARYSDLLLCFLPSRWESFQVARGDFFIKLAKAAAAEGTSGKMREAYFNLTVGTAKSPANEDGRLLFAEFHVAIHRPDLARKDLLGGLKYHSDDPKYLNTVFSFLLQQQMDEVVQAQADWLLPPVPVINNRNQIIALAKAQALFFRGNYDQAEDIFNNYGLNSTRAGLLLKVRIEWERGERATAMGHLRELRNFPQLRNDPEIYHLMVTWLRELDRPEEASDVSRLQAASDPKNPYPRIDLLFSLKKDGNDTALREAIDSILREFAANDAALLALADYAANVGDFPLARQIYLHCKDDPSGHLNWEYPALMQIESHIVAKNYQAALNLANDLLAPNPDWKERYAAVIRGLQAIAYFGLGDEAGGQLALKDFINQPRLRAENLLAVSRRLMDIGARPNARAVLAKAVQTDPLSQPALT
ncbi:MAG: hypothetical protein WCL04_02120, partial [Verrucomicrobiota bacterium]